MKRILSSLPRLPLLAALSLVALSWLAARPVAAQDAAAKSDDTKTTEAAPVDLSKIQWETNMDDPFIGDPKAVKGGTLHDYMDAYPLTFRLMGPNSNDAFANFNRAYTMSFSLVWRHPVTDRFIPCLATHWSVQDDHKTLYFKLDPDARWSDGKPVTADDYVFTLEMMRSPHIVDPWYTNYADTYFESIQAIDTHTLKIVGKQASWRPLEDYALFPMPRHAIRLGPDWVKEANNEFQVAAGPYVVTEAEPGKRVVFTHLKNWWGEKKRYFTGMYNVEKIELVVISDSERAFDYFKKGQIDLMTIGTAKRWASEMEFDAIQNGWMHKKRIFVQFPQGMYGFAMNLGVPLFQNKDFRKALQYLFNFEQLNHEMMNDAYYRMASAFEGTEYASPEVKPYPFDPRKAREHLQKAGFAKRGNDGILVDANGRRASFTLIYGSKSIERHMTVIKEMYKRAGIEMILNLLEPGTAFERGLERKYELSIMSRATGFYPEPHQYFSTEFKATTNNNNIWNFGTPETDKLIQTYRFDLDKQKRLDAMHQLDAILHDEAFYVPFWTAPYIRIAYWDYIRFPENYLPLRTEGVTDWQIYWIDPAKQARLKEAMAKGEKLGEDKTVDIDAYGVKKALEEREAESKKETKK